MHTTPRLTMLIWSREKDTPRMGGSNAILLSHANLSK